MIKSLIAITILNISFVATAFGLWQVDLSAGPGLRNVADAFGNPIANGNEVRIGFFEDGFDVIGNADNLLELDRAWNTNGTTAITTIFAQQGRFALSATSHNAATEGLQFYLWVFSTEDAATPEADYSNVDYYGLYSDEDWLFPSTSAIGIPNLLTATTSQVTESLYGSFSNESLILDEVVGVVVPEPSTNALFLGVIMILVVLARLQTKDGRNTKV